VGESAMATCFWESTGVSDSDPNEAISEPIMSRLFTKSTETINESNPPQHIKTAATFNQFGIE
jgi:hypothetical protein